MGDRPHITHAPIPTGTVLLGDTPVSCLFPALLLGTPQDTCISAGVHRAHPAPAEYGTRAEPSGAGLFMGAGHEAVSSMPDAGLGTGRGAGCWPRVWVLPEHHVLPAHSCLSHCQLLPGQISGHSPTAAPHWHHARPTPAPLHPMPCSWASPTHTYPNPAPLTPISAYRHV